MKNHKEEMIMVIGIMMMIMMRMTMLSKRLYVIKFIYLLPDISKNWPNTTGKYLILGKLSSWPVVFWFSPVPQQIQNWCPSWFGWLPRRFPKKWHCWRRWVHKLPHRLPQRVDQAIWGSTSKPLKRFVGPTETIHFGKSSSWGSKFIFMGSKVKRTI